MTYFGRHFSSTAVGGINVLLFVARSVAAGRGGHSPPAALSRGRHFEGRKYGILKISRFWQIDVCIAERVGL